MVVVSRFSIESRRMYKNVTNTYACGFIKFKVASWMSLIVFNETSNTVFRVLQSNMGPSSCRFSDIIKCMLIKVASPL